MKSIRRIRHLIILSLVCALLDACYEDKGNYEFHDIPESVITELPDDHIAYRFNTLRLSPTMVTEYGDDSFTYSWKLFSGIGLSSYLGEISTEKELEYSVTETSGSYKLLFTAVSKRTGVPISQVISLTITALNTGGLYVLKDIDGKAEVDLHLNNNRIRENYLENGLFTSIEGTPKQITFTYRLGNHLVVMTDKALMSIDYMNDMIGRGSTEDFFLFVPPDDFETRFWFANSDTFGLITEEGIIYRCSNYQGSYRFGDPNRMPDRTLDYDLHPQIVNLREPVVFDRISRSFLKVPSITPRMVPLPMDETNTVPVSDMDYDMVYMGTNRYPEIHALMRHIETGEYKMFVIIRYRLIPVDWWVSNIYDFAEDSGFVQALIKCIHERSDILYYVTDNQILRCRFSGVDEMVAYSPPAGETITHIETGYKNITITTHKEGRYHIRRFATDDLGLVIHSEQTVSVEGEGRAVSYVKAG